MASLVTIIVAKISELAIIFGGVVPYVPQYLDIRKTRNADGFSIFVCFTLVVANILRVFFWFGRHFELPLLLQSIIMIVTMLLMVQICVSVKVRSDITAQSRTFFGSGLKHFWKWDDFLSYLEFLLCFSALVGMVTYALLGSAVYVETLGFTSVFMEAMLGMPQFYRNFQNKSTAGMSKVMVAMWTSGDVFKTVYFLMRDAPAQFWICGVIQILTDLAIGAQVLLYRGSRTSAKAALS